MQIVCQTKKVIFVEQKTKPEKSFLDSLTNSLTQYLDCLCIKRCCAKAEKVQLDITKLLGTNISREDSIT